MSFLVGPSQSKIIMVEHGGLDVKPRKFVLETQE